MLNFFDDYLEINKEVQVSPAVTKQPTEETMKAITSENCTSDNPQIVDNLAQTNYDDQISELKNKIEELTKLVNQNNSQGDD